MFGYFLITDSTPLLRSVSTDVPATPVTMTMLPLPCSWSARNWPPSCPNLTWSVLTVKPHLSVTMLSNEITMIPRAQACLTMPFSPVGDAASMTMALTPCEIRLEIWWVCLPTSLPELQTEHETCDLNG